MFAADQRYLALSLRCFNPFLKKLSISSPLHLSMAAAAATLRAQFDFYPHPFNNFLM